MPCLELVVAVLRGSCCVNVGLKGRVDLVQREEIDWWILEKIGLELGIVNSPIVKVTAGWAPGRLWYLVWQE